MVMTLLAMVLAAETPPHTIVPDALVPPPEPMLVEIAVDPITDAVRASAILRDDGHRLVVSCEPARYDGARISFHSRRWLARGNIFTGERPLVHRFDHQAPRRLIWDIDDRRGQLLGQRRAESFLQSLFGAERLVIRAKDIENRRFDMIFRLEQVRPAVEQALQACEAGEGARHH